MSHAITEAKPGSPEATCPVPPSAPAVPFTEAEREAFVQDDKHAAAAVSGIMLGIFLMAVVMYTVIAVIASNGVP